MLRKWLLRIPIGSLPVVLWQFIIFFSVRYVQACICIICICELREVVLHSYTYEYLFIYRVFVLIPDTPYK